MTPELATILSGLFASASLIGVAVITQRQNRKGAAATTRLQERTIEREEFDSIARELRASLAEVRAELGEEVTARKAAEKRAGAAERRAHAADQRATRLEARVEQLERVLEQNDITVPPADQT